MNWETALATVANNVEKHFDRMKYRLFDSLGLDKPLLLIPYLGYGSSRRLFLSGRLLENPGDLTAGENDKIWNNLLDMFRRLESDEVPGARVRARLGHVTQETITDEEGFFSFVLDPGWQQAPLDLWQQVELEVVASQRQTGASQATGSVLVPPQDARYGIISDIDDTVMQSDATNLLRMARHVFLGNARTRLPFPGVRNFYQALQAGAAGAENNPLFYVSSSPWNFYDLLVEFFGLQQIPLGPFFLRDWGVSAGELLPTNHMEHKLGVIRRILDFYDEKPFILIGDSGQQDPEIYAEVVRAYPGRILAIYIRDVSVDVSRDAAVEALAEEVSAAASELILAEDTTLMAEHAALQGLVRPAAVADVLAATGPAELGLLERVLEDETHGAP
jgi:phosphatidate phosphatase APP1